MVKRFSAGAFSWFDCRALSFVKYLILFQLQQALRLKWEGTKGAFYKVAYPDGRQGYISKSISMPEKKWRATLKQDAASIIATAHSMMGIPYLWAGTSSKGVDCSGFMRTVLFMHDIIIPRDASQQAYVGEHIDITPDFSNLQQGTCGPCRHVYRQQAFHPFARRCARQ